MSWLKDKLGWPHCVCAGCKGIGHKASMVVIPWRVMWEYECELLRAKYGRLPMYRIDPGGCIYHPECSPLRERKIYGGYELTEMGKTMISDAKASRLATESQENARDDDGGDTI